METGYNATGISTFEVGEVEDQLHMYVGRRLGIIAMCPFLTSTIGISLHCIEKKVNYKASGTIAIN